MPKIFEYLGIVLKFWSDDHEPIHIHAISSDGRECKVLIYLKNSKITRIAYQNVNGKKPLTLPQKRKLKTLVNEKKLEIVNAWIKFFILKDRVKVEKITKKIK